MVIIVGRSQSIQAMFLRQRRIGFGPSSWMESMFVVKHSTIEPSPYFL